jgi:uncharacterized delta-60 repeat protein
MRILVLCGFLGLIVLAATSARAAGESLWTKRYGYAYAGADYPKGMVVDKDGNIIVAGYSFGGAGTYYDYAVVKYDSAGRRLWAVRYNGGPNANDEPFGVAVDKSGNIIVTGAGSGTRGVGGLPDILTVKFSPAGKFLWARRYYATTDGAHEQGRAVATDRAGNVFVAGISSSTTNTYQNAVLIKYSPSGVRQWVRTYDAPFHDNDGYFAVAVDMDGNVFATGFSTQSGLHYQDVLTVKYDSAGVLQWRRLYNGEDSIEDWAESIAVDGKGNAVVTGSTGEACDTAEEVCYNYATIKYSPKGVRDWVAIYKPLPISDNMAHAVRVDGAGNVFVTGESAWQSAFYDFATVKYSPGGKQLWAKRYDGVGKGNDMAYNLAVDSNGNVSVVGQSYVSLDAEADFAVVNYSSAGTQRWVRRYNGPGGGMDMAFFVAVDAQDNVVASGFSLGDSTTAEDFVTVKYAP